MRLLALLLILLPLPAAASGIAFVINSNDASISLIDVTTQKELRRVPVLREPHHLALSPDGTRGYADFVGPLRTGKLVLRSEPPLADTKIVALILFGAADVPAEAGTSPPVPTSSARRP